MAVEAPGWCKHCGAELVHANRSPGRARHYCGDACRQAFSRQVRLRRSLIREVGLTAVQVDRLLAHFCVTARPLGAGIGTIPGQAATGGRATSMSTGNRDL